MKISIITATYNSQATIADCVQSVLAQTHPDIEYIIIDGQSTDDTLKIIGQLKNQASHTSIHVVSEPDNGIYDALNKGIKLATGAVIGFVHSDDLLTNTTSIATITEQFKDESVDAVYGDLDYVTFGNTAKVVRQWRSQPFKPSLLAKGWMPPHPTLYLRAAFYKTIGVFNTDYKIAADYDFILRAFSQPNFKAVYMPQTIVTMRVGGASNRSLQNIIVKSKEDYKALRQNKVGGCYSLFLKNVSKISQFIARN